MNHISDSHTSTSRLLAEMSEDRLEQRLRALAWGEKQVLAGFLRHLDEFDRRRAHAPRGFPSLFEYCTRELGLSQDEAYLRILAARRSRDFPEVLGMLARGEIHLSGLAKLSPHLDSGNGAKLLAEARGKSKREIEAMVAGLMDAAPIQPDAIRFLQPPRPKAEARSPGNGGSLHLQIPPPVAPPVGAAVEAAPEVFRSARLVRIAFTCSEALLSKIARAKVLLRRKHPSGRLELLTYDAFDALLAKHDPLRRPPRNRTPDKHRPDGKPKSRRIPGWVKDQVWRRDEGRCAYVSSTGRRCSGEVWLEYDHIKPWALGGSSNDPANIRLACRTHNQLAGEEVFGKRPRGKRRKTLAGDAISASQLRSRSPS